MPRSLNAPLSPHEEVTLRRVALGIANTRDLSQQDLRRLKQLELVVEVRGQPELTALGRKRYYALPRAIELSDASRSGIEAALENYIRKARTH